MLHIRIILPIVCLFMIGCNQFSVDENIEPVSQEFDSPLQAVDRVQPGEEPTTNTNVNLLESSQIDFGQIHNCGLDFLVKSNWLHDSLPPSNWMNYPALADHLEDECGLFTLSTGFLDSVSVIVSQSP